MISESNFKKLLEEVKSGGSRYPTIPQGTAFSSKQAIQFALVFFRTLQATATSIQFDDLKWWLRNVAEQVEDLDDEAETFPAFEIPDVLEIIDQVMKNKDIVQVGVRENNVEIHVNQEKIVEMLIKKIERFQKKEDELFDAIKLNEKENKSPLVNDEFAFQELLKAMGIGTSTGPGTPPDGEYEMFTIDDLLLGNKPTRVTFKDGKMVEKATAQTDYGKQIKRVSNQINEELLKMMKPMEKAKGGGGQRINNGSDDTTHRINTGEDHSQKCCGSDVNMTKGPAIDPFSAQFTNDPNLIFKPCDKELWREYNYPDNDETVFIESPIAYAEDDNGGQLVVDSEHVGHYIKPGWKQVSWKNRPGVKTFDY